LYDGSAATYSTIGEHFEQRHIGQDLPNIQSTQPQTHKNQNKILDMLYNLSNSWFVRGRAHKETYVHDHASKVATMLLPVATCIACVFQVHLCNTTQHNHVDINDNTLE
jgi:hypothetical protein